MKVFNVRTQQDFDIYFKDIKENGDAVLRGRSTTLDIGDVVEYTGHASGWQVVEIERRDHRGVFKNPKDKKNSSYIATCKEVNIYDIHEQIKQEEEDGTK